jgi:hypothetical protein
MFLNKAKALNYITNTSASQELDITVNHSFNDGEVLDVSIELSKDGNHSDTQEVSGQISYNGYYSTLSLSGLNVSLESFYSMKVSSLGKIIYKGKAFVTNQTIGEYEINNNNYIKQTTDTTNFTIFE